MIKQRKIELLAPAKNLECGMAAIDQHYTQPFSDSLNTPLG